MFSFRFWGLTEQQGISGCPAWPLPHGAATDRYGNHRFKCLLYLSSSHSQTYVAWETMGEERKGGGGSTFRGTFHRKLFISSIYTYISFWHWKFYLFMWYIGERWIGRVGNNLKILLLNLYNWIAKILKILLLYSLKRIAKNLKRIAYKFMKKWKNKLT